MSLSPLLLLVLLGFLAEVHSQTEFPYVSFMGETLHNHSFINLSLVGDPYRDGGEGIHCHTNLTTCCNDDQGPHRGDWYFPNGSRLPFSGDGDIYELRADNKVILRRRNNANMPSGLYRCDIPTNDDDISVRESVYVGLYTTRGDITISDDVTVDSSLDFRDTLTCISIGGPATTVIWTRNCIPITERTNTVVDDKITAQYTHNLSVYRLFDGVYTCNVSNNKPSQDSAVYPAEVRYLTLTSIKIYPINSTTVRISWSSRHYLSTSLQYTSYFSATGAMMSQSERVLALGVTATDVTLDDEVDGYEHNFTLRYIICDIIPTPTTTVSFTFDKKHFQIQFGPIDYCLDWGIEKTNRIEYQLQSRLANIIREQCTDCFTFSPAYLRQGLFLCHGNPTNVTYRSTLVNPFSTTTSADLVRIIQRWVSTNPYLILDGLLVRVSPRCPTCIAALDADECDGALQSDSAEYERITHVLSVCAARQLRTYICDI